MYRYTYTHKYTYLYVLLPSQQHNPQNTRPYFVEMEVEMEDDNTAVEFTFTAVEVDLDYEYEAARFFDFTRVESIDEARQAEMWFDSVDSYPPSRKLLLI